MARRITMDFPHHLGARKAKQLVAQRLDMLRGQYGDKLGSSGISWLGNDAQVSVSAFGQTATGQVFVGDDNIRIDVRLPLLLSPLSGKIGAVLAGVANDALEK